MTSTNPMTLEQARGWLLQAVETQGRDFVYNTRGGMCFYVPQTDFGDGDPKTLTGCLIGVALTLAGRTATDFEYHGGSVYGEQEAFRLTSEAAEYFSKAQHVQDMGDSWGAAYDKAEEWAA